MMKVGLIGYGYWGKILKRNIETITNNKIAIYDPYINVINDINDCDKIFIATPVSSHKETVEKYLRLGKDVFCEKPLCTNTDDVVHLYNLAEENKCDLFVDWIFTFNDSINFIKKHYQAGTFGEIKHVSMNRLNSGPERQDISARWDLACHDVSILEYVFGQQIKKVLWSDLKRNPKSYRYDSSIGLLQYETFDAILHSSWYYGRKDRDCIFEFTSCILEWNDCTQSIKFNGQILEHTNGSPLLNSINNFLNGRCQQKTLTVNVTNILSRRESKWK